jgi:hypothetical protein
MNNIKYSKVPLADLVLDKDNPRIKRFLAMYGENPTPNQIHLALGAGGDYQSGTSVGTTFYSLKESIRVNGGIIHPIIINKDKDGGYTVIEGNTRVAIYRDFLESGVEGNWESIPCIIHEGLSQDELDSIRLQSHLVGPREWDPYSKAKYLHFLHSHQDMPFDRLVDYCGGRRSQVVEYIDAYQDMEKYYRPILGQNDDFDSTRFSGFVELQKKGKKDAIIAAGYDLKDFANWVKEGLIDPLRTVRDLPKILKDKEIRSVFLAEGAREAMKLVDRPTLDSTLGDANLVELCKATTTKIKMLNWNDVKSVREKPDGQLSQAIQSLMDEVSDLTEYIEQS